MSICAEAKETKEYKEYVKLEAQLQQTSQLYTEVEREYGEIMKQQRELEIRAERNRIESRRLSGICENQEFHFRQIRCYITTCKKGDNCPFFLPLEGERKADDDSPLAPDFCRYCVYYHTKAQIAAFEIREKKRIADLNETRRLQREAKVAQKEAKEYQYKYCSLGAHIKEALQFPDEVCHIIRSYCASRHFIRGSPSAHWKNSFKDTPCLLRACKQCPAGRLFCRQYKTNCSFCTDKKLYVTETLPYMLLRKLGEKMEARFLHKECAHLLGMTCDTDHTLLRDDVRNYSGDTFGDIQLINNLQVCLIDRHLEAAEN